MKERPILFSTPMVQAILEERKTQTRRVVKQFPTTGYRWNGWICEPQKDRGKATVVPESNWKYCATGSIKVRCPYGQPGDRLWVRESARVINVRGGTREIDIEYQADKTFATVPYPARLAPAPKGKLLANGTYREASRILLEIDSVRVERLNDISEEDAKAEGLSGITKDGLLVKYGIPDRDGLPGNDNTGWPWSEWKQNPRDAFRKLWESINGPGSWDANPWVWVVEFKRVEA